MTRAEKDARTRESVVGMSRHELAKAMVGKAWSTAKLMLDAWTEDQNKEDDR